MKPRKGSERPTPRGATGREPSQGKLSARLIAIAGPWIERLGPEPPLLAVEFAYQTCGAVWNVSRVEDAAAREEIVGELRKGVLSAAPKGAEGEVGQLFDILYERAVGACPEDRRTVANLAVVDLGGGSFRIDVASLTGGIAP